MTERRRAAVVGIGSTDYYKRGGSLPQTANEMAAIAILAAVEDAGLTVDEIDGFAYYSNGFDTGWFAQALGIPEIKFTASLTGGGSGSAGSVGLAATAIAAGQADVVVSLMTLQQVPSSRLGAAMAATTGPYYRPPTPEKDFISPYGVFAPGHFFSLIAQRHMYEFGTTREHFAEVAINTRNNALNRPKALHEKPLTLDEYFGARMISDPLCLYDYTMESDGAVAVITTSADRAKDLRQTPAYVLAGAAGGDGRWGRGIGWMGMPDDLFPTAGAGAVARLLYERGGVGPDDVDVALLYDHFTPMVLLQLEDYGFCARGESGPFVADGNIRMGGRIPVNTHGGNLSEAYIIGMTHVVEAVEQIRGTAINQVPGAEIALVTGGPSGIPVSGLLLQK
ncbi:MAG: thiolase [Ilumatobacteraceae bacterium]|nr:thiolase [Ilumatobacteraceae bacterium]